MSIAAQVDAPWTIVDRLRKAREEAVDGYMKQKELAERSGVSLRTVSNYESPTYTGARKRYVVSAWALATGWSAEWLWTGEGEPITRWNLQVPGQGAFEFEDDLARLLDEEERLRLVAAA